MKNSIISVYFIIGLWIALFICGRFISMNKYLCGKGFDLIAGRFYRYITASFLHENLFHLAANCLGLYFITIYLDGKINSVAIAVFAIISATVSNMIFSLIYRGTESFVGGSVIIYSVIGLIVIMQLRYRDSAPFMLGTWYGNWTLGYFILANLINGSAKRADISSIMIHGISFVVGMVLGAIIMITGMIRV